MKPILEVRNLSKKYVLGRKNEPYKTLRDSLLHFWKAPEEQEEFWALDDLSFDVFPGDSLAIIG
ncbi:MAG TPA: ABC transporter ATP-binding protein, partial [Bacteroidia bacterium]|nr:ABC transporter ATP-binding protein [Bacteroidia bacterium]